jgi:TolA-binding protein
MVGKMVSLETSGAGYCSTTRIVLQPAHPEASCAELRWTAHVTALHSPMTSSLRFFSKRHACCLALVLTAVSAPASPKSEMQHQAAQKHQHEQQQQQQVIRLQQTETREAQLQHQQQQQQILRNEQLSVRAAQLHQHQQQKQQIIRNFNAASAQSQAATAAAQHRSAALRTGTNAPVTTVNPVPSTPAADPGANPN